MDTSFASASEELATLVARFPDVDAEVVSAVLESHHQNAEAACETLLSMTAVSYTHLTLPTTLGV